MAWGKQLLLASVVLATTACTADKDVEVRAIANPIAAAAQRGTPMIDEARGLLALGNVGLALEAFRKARRDRPDSFQALAGIAECYERMGRYDLANANYEAALAIAPNHPALLNSYAALMDIQGRKTEALALRAEAARAKPLIVRAIVPAIVPGPVVATAVPATSNANPVPVAPVAALTVKLPPARPVAPGRDATENASPHVPLTSPTTSRAAAVVTPGRSPVRLERLSPGEVALVTANGPLWQPQVVARTRRSATVRFVPLRNSGARPTIRVLNAARREGLAARTRQVLVARGWRKIDIGDANAVRARSLVLYPADRQLLGRRLAAQFGFRSAMTQRGDALVVLLGRDAAAVRGRPAG